jgi:hypothetical protein
MKKLVLTCFLLALTTALWAQERSVSGKVSSSEDNSPLPGVNVLLQGTTIGTVTDASGLHDNGTSWKGNFSLFLYWTVNPRS